MTWSVRHFAWAFGLTVVAGLIGVFALTSIRMDDLGDASMFTGRTLLFALLFLGALNWRKRLSTLPLGRTAYWLAAHWIIGLATLICFWIHTDSLWPLGAYEQWLAAAFYVTTVTGIAGQVIQATAPRRLTQTGSEIIYERIPEAVHDLRRQAEATVVACARESGSSTLARHYGESLDWFFRKPRFYFSHMFGMNRGEHWVRHQLALVARYLDETERAHLAQLESLASRKNSIDLQYALQDVMKRWLLAHVPAAAVTVLLAGWHVLLVYAYAQ